MESLFTPWRYRYLSMTASDEGCFFCAAARRPEDPESLVVLRTPHHLVLLNRYPYTNGHLMVAPREHLAEPGSAPPEARAELWPLALRCQRVLARLYRPASYPAGRVTPVSSRSSAVYG
jgi:ATP adenylyltransferase